MITYDDVSYELDTEASGLTLVLPLADESPAGRRPFVMGDVRLTGGALGPERGDFVGQDMLKLLVPAAYRDFEHWSEIDGAGNEQKGKTDEGLANRLLLSAVEVNGEFSDMMNMSVRYSYSLRHTGGFEFFLDLEGLFLPMEFAAQVMFGFGPNRPPDEELQEMCEALRVMEVLPLYRVVVWTPTGEVDRIGWAKQMARERLGLEDLSESQGGRYRGLDIRDRATESSVVTLFVPWAAED